MTRKILPGIFKMSVLDDQGHSKHLAHCVYCVVLMIQMLVMICLVTAPPPSLHLKRYQLLAAAARF